MWSVAFSPDGKTLASGTADGKIVLWDVDRGVRRKSFTRTPGGVSDVLFLSAGAVLASTGLDTTLKCWDAHTGELRAILKGHEAAVNSLAVCGKGQQVASAGADRTVRVWTVPSSDDHVLYQIPSATMLGTAFSPDKQCLAWIVKEARKRLLFSLPRESSSAA